jgi:hypothetical protein
VNAIQARDQTDNCDGEHSFGLPVVPTGRVAAKQKWILDGSAPQRGPDTQNHAGLRDFRAHLEGRVAWVEQLNARRGQRLRRIFDEIKW